ncbi:MAG: DUF4255 domain-containing protein [Bacteroidia bacterium]|nr:DUF4255 domain-containing protein [Bacteroidia bacterium]
MIHEVLPVIIDELNDFFQARFDIAEDKVVLANIVNQDGSVAVEGENRIVVSLINVERDGSNQLAGGMSGSPPVHINLYLMFSAYFENHNYVEALKFLSGVIGFFQGKSMFNHQNTSMFPRDANQVRMEIVNIDFRELSNLWACLGAKYMPSVIYRLRTLNMDEENINDDAPRIARPLGSLPRIPNLGSLGAATPGILAAGDRDNDNE